MNKNSKIRKNIKKYKKQNRKTTLKEKNKTIRINTEKSEKTEKTKKKHKKTKTNEKTKKTLNNT